LSRIQLSNRTHFFNRGRIIFWKRYYRPINKEYNKISTNTKKEIIMKTSKEMIISKFREIKGQEYIPSNRENNTGIGKTLEDYMDIEENNKALPDFEGYELKSHRSECNSYITLFTKSPNFPPRANTYIINKFGCPYEENPNLKKLHTSMFATKFNTFNGRYSFRLIHDKEAEVLKIGVYDIHTKELIDNSVGYTYSCLERKLHTKLKNLFYVTAKREYRKDGIEHFYYDKAEIYTNPSLNKFLDLVDRGLIMYDIRIGSYKSGKSLGKAHDHGSGFRILESNIKLLYAEREVIE